MCKYKIQIMRMPEKIVIPVGVLGMSVLLSLFTTTIGETTSGKEYNKNMISRYCTEIVIIHKYENWSSLFF